MLAPAGGECALSGSWLERLKSNPASAGLAIGVISCRGVDTIFEDWIRLARIGAGCRGSFAGYRNAARRPDERY